MIVVRRIALNVLLLAVAWGIAVWVTALTHFTCSSGYFTATDGLGGVPIGAGQSQPETCTNPTVPGWLGLATLAVLLVVVVLGSLRIWKRPAVVMVVQP